MYGLEVESIYEFFCVDSDVVFADSVEWVFQVVLDVVEAYHDESHEDWHDVCEGEVYVFGDVCEVWAIDDGHDADEDSGVCSQCSRGSVLVDVFYIFERDDHFAEELVAA